MSTLLAFHRTILQQIHDPASNDLLILARGLGLRRIICTLTKIYDSPKNLVLLVNATPEEESAIGEELGIMGCKRPGLRVVSYETPSKDRQNLYKQGGIISVTSRILVVDMLQSDIPIELITGLLVLHAEKVTALVLEAFIVRLYREKNKQGFVKAFSDQPEHIMSGYSPLKNIMTVLQIRNVHIYPRFHDDIKKSLERRRADAVELSQDLTENMLDIHHAIVQCMNSTLSELKRSNTRLDLDDFNVENSYFRSFEIIVRRQLDSVWHRVGPRTKQLVNDLGTLRQLLYYLLTYDPLQFHSYLETLIAANTVTTSGTAKQHQSPWMLTDAAHIIFQSAKRRCFTLSAVPTKEPVVIDLADDEDAWAALDEMEGEGAAAATGSRVDKGKGKETEKEDKPAWLPRGMDPVLEELPKWNLLSEVLLEIEGEMIRQENMKRPGSKPINESANIVLIMTSSTRTCNLLTNFLDAMDHDAPPGMKGRKMMMRKLSEYLWWKQQAEKDENKKGGGDGGGGGWHATGSRNGDRNSEMSEAMKKKDKERAEKAQSRRRLRGGAPGATSARPGAVKSEPVDIALSESIQDSDNLALYWQSQEVLPSTLGNAAILDFDSATFTSDFDEYYGVVPQEQTVIIRAYSDDSDDRLLAELKPKFVVMYEPDMDFIRRIEVYKSSNPTLPVRVYHMLYGNSCEEHKYLAGLRKEKDAFEKLIKERSSMVITLVDEQREGIGRSESVIKTISTRLAGGRRELNTEPSRVIVDMREFRSSLPSLLHASRLMVIPATLTVGDYILTPDICVERKSLSDLVSSFNSGRLYTQCEVMTAYYKYPILLIEFEEDKSFSLDSVTDIKSYAKPSGKYPPKKNTPNADDSGYSFISVQSKLVLLTLNFPRVRIIWSSSPYATAEIFNDLKMSNPEPDPVKAISVGADDDPDVGLGVNRDAEELLRCLPGINGKNIKNIMNKVKDVREFCSLDVGKMQELMGEEAGWDCWRFIHRGESKGRK
ncbi:hypothetical protein BJ165DRAFT_1349294 [Panaeolus papilionaceus]|nr:hypothetical protein BJ165DRAFT_1349294 [Panaeolus papilionaceus]